jgi:hypothetical protein
MKFPKSILSAIIIFGVIATPARAADDLANKIGEVLADYHQIKPGMTRAELAKLFHYCLDISS